MPFCTNCGKNILETAKFCTNCGTPVKKPLTSSTPNTYSSITKSVNTSQPIKPTHNTYTTQVAPAQHSTGNSLSKIPSEKKEKDKKPKERTHVHFVFDSSHSSMKHSLAPTISDFNFIKKDPKDPVAEARKKREKEEKKKMKQEEKLKKEKVLHPNNSSPSLLGLSRHGDVVVSVGSPKSSSSTKKCKYCKKCFGQHESYKTIFGHYYHDQCVHCYKCDQRIFSTSKYYNYKGKILCHPCMLKKLPKCYHCGNPISGDYIVVGNKNYHSECAPAC